MSALVALVKFCKPKTLPSVTWYTLSAGHSIAALHETQSRQRRLKPVPLKIVALRFRGVCDLVKGDSAQVERPNFSHFVTMLTSSM